MNKADLAELWTISRPLLWGLLLLGLAGKVIESL